MSIDHRELIARLSLEQKVRLLTGETAFTLPGEPAIGLEPMAFSDGPTGVRGLKFVGGEAVALFPNATLISGAWDDEVAREVGRMLAEEAKRQHIHVVLGPTINLHRTPLGGRLFEAYSEDPYLTGRIATAYVDGMQHEGVGACLKHLVANESETLRNFMDSRVSEAALRETYLLPFEMAVQDAHPWSMMAAYNAVNGVWATEQDHVQNEIVKSQWRWDGLIMSDWYATKRTAESINGGLDLVMPGPEGPWGERLVAAVRDGRVLEATVDRALERLLRLAERTGALTAEGDAVRAWPEHNLAPDAPERTAQLRRIAARGMTLLRNETGVLPLAGEGTVALIGRPGVATTCMGGGSATVNPPYQVTIAEGLARALGERVRVVDGPEVRERPMPARTELLTDPRTGEPGCHITYLDAQGQPMMDFHTAGAAVAIGWDDGLEELPAKAVFETTLTGVEGPTQLGAIGSGSWRIDAGGHTLTAELGFDGVDPGEAMLRPPSFREVVDLPAGATVTATLELTPASWDRLLERDELGLAPESHLLEMAPVGVSSLVVAPAPRPDDELIEQACEAARSADVAVVVVGLTEEAETEAADKQTLALPGRQDELVHRVAAAASRTVVLVNAGTPVLMPWVDEVDAVLVVGLPGQEGGHAVADVLTGRAEPTGRLVTTYPAADGASPAWAVQPGESFRLEYAEGSAIGYRGFHGGDVPAPLFWFGSGLGWGRWEYGDVELIPGAAPGVRLPVTNTGSRPSREVVQLYLEPQEQGQPVRLVGFTGVEVQPGESVAVQVTADPRLLRAWDEDSGDWRALTAGRLLVARGLGDIRGDVQWRA